MKRFLLFLVAFVLLSIFWFYSTTRSNLKPTIPAAIDVVMVITNSSDAKLVQPFSPTTAASNELIVKLPDEPFDVLSATNLEQWKSLIKDLKQDRTLRNHWMTARFGTGTPPVLFKHNGQSIIYEAEAVDVSVIPDTADLLVAQIYSHKMDIDETRELGLKLCSMFGFDSNKFQAWCSGVGNNWLDAPLFGIGNHSYRFNVRRSYNAKQPWYIVFSIPQESAVLKLLRKPSHRLKFDDASDHG